MSMKGKIAAIAAMAAMFGGHGFGEPGRSDKNINTAPKKPPIPKGCKEYFFFEDGTQSDSQHPKTVFSCIAMNGKNARNKFDKFKTR